MTVREAFVRASSFLGERGVSEAPASSELLLQHVLGISRAKLLTIWSDPIDGDRFDEFWTLLQRRASGEPVQYITGEAYFYGCRFAVTKAVLIPRPETELLVERIALLGDELWGKEGAPLAVDIGTGSGAIAVSLAKERRCWRIVASDISPEALEVARANSAANEAEVAFLEGDLLEPAAKQYGREIDILVSNPPYIRAADLAGLQVEVRDFEPALALVGGKDGLAMYKRMMEQMAAFGVWPRLIGFEVGLGQAQEVAGLLRETEKWQEIAVVLDYAGIERHVIGIRR